MFITEAQLALYKYQAGGKYFNEPMACIAHAEYSEFIQYSHKSIDLIGCFSFFLNRRINENLWHIYFKDDSMLIIKRENFQDGAEYKIESVSNIFSFLGG